MSDNKREQERTELYRTIWALANELRGSVDGWDFKQYVLGMLFYRYISENLTTYLNKGEWDAGNTDFDYAKISDEEALKTEKHFTALVKQEDIENADYNLSVSTYVEREDTREAIDIAVLNKQISEIVQRENTLRAEIDAIIAEIEEA